MWENIAGAKRYFCRRGLSIAGASDPVAPAGSTPLLSPYRCMYQSDLAHIRYVTLKVSYIVIAMIVHLGS